MNDFKGPRYRPELNKRNEWLNKIEDITVDDRFIYAAKRIHDEKTIARDDYDMRTNGRLRKSSKHAENLPEEALYVGMLGEAVIAWKYGVIKCWFEEQKKQIEIVKKYGFFDTIDIGRTQIRTGYYDERMVSIIVRPGDFISKSGQPIVGCVYYPKNKSMKICGWTTLEEVKNRDTQFGSYGGDGTSAFMVAPYDLNPMSTFDENYLK